MTDEKRYSEAEAHRLFAVILYNQVWDLLAQDERSQGDSDLMRHLAHASLCHWLQVGTGLHQQRGEWMLSRVYTVLEMPDLALYHARRCLALTEEHRELMQDFDFAFANEAMARALALAGDLDQAREYWHQADQAGRQIVDQEDREIFQADLAGGSWHGLGSG